MTLGMGVLGALIVLVVLWDAFETMVLPRRVTRRFRLAALFFRLTWRPWSALAHSMAAGRRRESYLGYYGPLSTLLLLTVWAAGMVLGFALLHWAAGSHLHAPEQTGFATDLYMSGTTYFTLGLGDVTPLRPLERAFTVIEAGLGFGFLALVVGYLPVLYSAFSKREATITLMDARAGSPSSAFEMLQHYQGNPEGLTDWLRKLESWTAELLESHISYPALSYFRSQHDNQSWLAAMTTILDACALVMAGACDHRCRQAELTFAIARHAVVDISQVLNRPPRPPDPDRLPREQFERQASHGDYIVLAGLRALYEPYVNSLAEHLAMRLPPWVSERRALHNWETTAWERFTSRVPQQVGDDHV